MNIRKLKWHEATVSVGSGESGNIESNFDAAFDGNIVAFGTKVVGSMGSGETAQVSLKSGSATVVEPIDVSWTEITNGNNFENRLVGVNVANPGSMKAVITPSGTTASAYKVVVTAFYQDSKDTDQYCS